MNRMLPILIAGLSGCMLTAEAQTYKPFEMATLRTLDKITGRARDITVEAGAPVVFGALKIDMQVCFQTPPEEPPESVAFLKIRATQAVQVESLTAGLDVDATETTDAGSGAELFSGWMFASSPGLNALEHPVYDVWVIQCTASFPDMTELSEEDEDNAPAPLAPEGEGTEP